MAGRSGVWGSATLGALCAALFGCGAGDGDVVHSVYRTTSLDTSRILSMAGPEAALPLVAYGALWPGVPIGEVEQRLRLPNNFPPEIRFRQLDAERAADRFQDKIILVFNPETVAKPVRLCAGEGGAATKAPRNGPFELVAVFCSGDAVMGSGVLVAEGQQPGDWSTFTNVTRRFFNRILTDPSGRIER